jgi:hypothetical protein
MNRTVGISVIVAVVALVLIYSSTFFVQQSQNAVVVRFGKLIDTVTNEPGLHWRVPFVDHVFAIDRRIINIDAPAYTVTTKDQKRISLRHVRYQIRSGTFYRVAHGTGRGPHPCRSTRCCATSSAPFPADGHADGKARGADGSRDRACSRRASSSASTWSTCGSNVSICRRKTAHRSMTA